MASSSNNVGMKQERADGFACNLAKQQSLERPRRHPELRARFESILLSRNADGPLKIADEVEAQLIQELRQLGQASMNQWATQAEQRVGDELQRGDATVRSRKKNAAGGRVFGWARVQDRVWRNANQSDLRLLAARVEGDAAWGGAC